MTNTRLVYKTDQVIYTSYATLFGRITWKYTPQVTCIFLVYTLTFIRQGSLEVNLSVLIDSFLVWILRTDRFHGNGLKLCIVCFQQPANSINKHSSSSYNKLLTSLLEGDPYWEILALGHFYKDQ